MSTLVENKTERHPRTNNKLLRVTIIVLAAIILIQAVALTFLLLSRTGISLPKPPLGDFINIKDFGAVGDGSTNDSKAFTLAIKAAQSGDMGIYFPEGTYNLNNVDFTANTPLKIYGDGEKTVLYEPGQITCKSDVSVTDIAVFKRNGKFIYLKPTGYSDVEISRVKAYNDLKYAEDMAVVYALINKVGTNTGINKLEFSNNNISNALMGCYLKCEIKEGTVTNNILTNLGNPEAVKYSGGLVFGTVDAKNVWVPATNMMISDNKISGVYSLPGTESDAEVFSIMATGDNNTITRNYIEDQPIGIAIYSKSNNLKIADNTIIEAGKTGGICVKVTENEYNGGFIIIDNNTIVNSLLSTQGAIRVYTGNFLLTNNNIEMYDNLGANSSAAIRHAGKVFDATISGNTIYSEGLYGGVYIADLDGKLALTGNVITQNIKDNTGTPSVIRVDTATAESVVDCSDNTITIENGAYAFLAQSSSGIKDGSTLNFAKNTVVAPESAKYLINVNAMGGEVINNTINLNSSTTAESTAGGILSNSGVTSQLVINDNNIVYDGDNASYLFNLSTSFDMSGNTITFGDSAQLTSVINFVPKASASGGESMTITGNKIGDITSVLGDSDTANTDYFMRVATSSSGVTYPQIDINGNSFIMNLNVLTKTSSSYAIQSVGDVVVSDNFIHSVYTADVEAAVIKAPAKETNLVTGGNLELSAQVATELIEANNAAAAEIKRLADEAQRLEDEAAAAKRLSDEAAEAIVTLQIAEEEAILADFLAAEQVAAEEDARIAAEAADAFAQRLAEETAAAEAEVQRLAEEAAAAAEAEAQRLAEEAAAAAEAEAQRLAAETAAAEAEAARLAAEAAVAEAARIAAEEEARIAAEKVEAERRAADAEAAAIAAAAKAEADRIAAEAEAARAAAEAAAKAAAEQEARLAAEANARAEAEAEAERLILEQLAEERAAAAAAAEEAAILAAEEAARIAAEEAAAAEEAERIAAEEAAANDEKERIAAEEAAAAGEDSEKETLPQDTTEFTYFTTRDGYLVLQFSTAVECASNKCVTIARKSYRTIQYDDRTIIVDTQLTDVQRRNTDFTVTAKVVFPELGKKAQTITVNFGR